MKVPSVPRVPQPVQAGVKVWNLPFSSAFGCRAPIVSAPMAGVSGGLLAAEVTEIQIRLYIEVSGKPDDLAIGFIGFSSLATQSGWKNYEYIL